TGGDAVQSAFFPPPLRIDGGNRGPRSSAARQAPPDRYHRGALPVSRRSSPPESELRRPIATRSSARATPPNRWPHARSWFIIAIIASPRRMACAPGDSPHHHRRPGTHLTRGVTPMIRAALAFGFMLVAAIVMAGVTLGSRDLDERVAKNRQILV